MMALPILSDSQVSYNAVQRYIDVIVGVHEVIPFGKARFIHFHIAI